MTKAEAEALVRGIAKGLTPRIVALEKRIAALELLVKTQAGK